MTSTASLSPRASLLDLDILEADPAPTFVVKVGEQVASFEVLFGNEQFRQSGLREAVQGQESEATLFRAWSQALGYFKSTNEFAGRVWTAKVAGVNENWKVVRAADAPSEKEPAKTDEHPEERRAHMHKRSRDELLKRLDKKRGGGIMLNGEDETNLHARWESMQVMMEMSDVGVFEYEPSGKLIHANDAWYRLSNHPRNIPANTHFSFMDLAYPEDRDVIMSAWNTLTQGKSVTFEMRWKARPGSDLPAQWVLSSCVPVFDGDENLISIAGNTIDINGQKLTAEAAQARVDALEQARISEQKFARFAQLAPVAMFVYKPGKGLEFVNDQFYELTGGKSMDEEEHSITNMVLEEDAGKVLAEMSTMMEVKKLCQIEFRLKKTWVDQEGIRCPTWVQGSYYPECDENGDVVSVMGTVFDISHFKWAENMQRERIEAALEAKRQQENFIDMTSHELRNPLSAVVQCADSVLTTLHRLQPGHFATSTSIPPSIETRVIQDQLDSCVESLQTIISCSLHQKRIIDDVLTLSKLDSKLLLITPMRVNPVQVVAEAMNMFQAECSHSKIKLRLHSDDSLKGFEWVMMDPSRMLQVLINLFTNAIKFTKDREKKEITTTLGASWTRPDVDDWEGVRFADTLDGGDGGKEAFCNGEGWGTGKRGYIWFKVQDTGCGMTAEEQSKLFSRFTQATPRTHIKYGGSGLGLFVSKSLAALQGGSIGVSSKENLGSTFAFYISTRIAPGLLVPESPAAAAAASARPSVRRIASHNAATASFEAAMKRAHLRILMVEDNLVNQRVLSRQLQNVGCTVSVAGNGVEALEWLKGSVYWRGEGQDDAAAAATDPTTAAAKTNGGKADTPNLLTPAEGDGSEAPRKNEVDIILMDIEMPIMNGLSCARHIRQYEEEGLLRLPPQPSDRPSSVSGARTYKRHSYHASTSTTLAPPNGGYFEPRDCDASTAGSERLRLPILAVSANARGEQIEQALKAGMDDAISKPFRIPDLWPKMVSLVPRCSWTRD